MQLVHFKLDCPADEPPFRVCMDPATGRDPTCPRKPQIPNKSQTHRLRADSQTHRLNWQGYIGAGILSTELPAHTEGAGKPLPPSCKGHWLGSCAWNRQMLTGAAVAHGRYGGAQACAPGISNVASPRKANTAPHRPKTHPPNGSMHQASGCV